MPWRHPAVSLTSRLPPRCRTVRVRLTAFYGGLFLLAGVVLLTITNILVNHTTGDVVYSARPADRFQPASPDGRSARSDHLPMDARQLHAELGRLHARDVHQFLVQSGVALAITAVACIALGYVLASRALRPVRTITAQARTISAHNLHKRVKVEGPADELKLLGDTSCAHGVPGSLRRRTPYGLVLVPRTRPPLACSCAHGIPGSLRRRTHAVPFAARWSRISREYHSALDFGVRTRVSKSTWITPNRILYPSDHS